MEYTYSKFHKIAIRWLVFFTIACFTNSVLVIVFELYTGDEYLEPIMNGRHSLPFLLPFAHVIIVIICFVIYSAYCGTRGRKSGIWDKYIEEHYPEIWERFHPWGPRSYCNLCVPSFVAGKYDDGSDEKLNRIKFRLKVQVYLMLWTFFLAPVVWIFNIVLMLTLNRFSAQ